jgi:hypothetical protein
VILRQANHFAAIVFCLLFVAGCPSTTPTAPSIDQVVPEPNAAQRDFRLKVVGRGFGLKSVQFDLSKREGLVSTSSLALDIKLGGDVIKRIDRVELESTQVLYAQVTLDRPLTMGLYDVALLEGGTEIALKPEAFFAPGENGELPDGGPGDANLEKDGAPLDGDIERDADVDAGDAGDVGAPDDGGVVVPDDGGPIDADTPDVGTPDSGLGPFPGAYGYRRLISPNNTVLAPANVTIEIPIPHATMLADGTASNADGSDLAIYQGADRLAHQWRDEFVLGTDQLVIVARLVRDLPIGGSETDPLVLYSSDPNATPAVTDAVFEFSERFFAPVPGTWYEANNWGHCNLDRPIEATTNPNGSYCAIDASASNLARQTLGTPNLAVLQSAPGADLVYEQSVWLAGRMIDGPADIIYFAYGPQPNVFDNTINPPVTAYAGFVPNAQLTFQDTDNQPRTADGWRFPPDVIQWWQRMTLRWTPTIDAPSLHFRHISTNANASTSSFAAIDDWTVRLALEPDFAPVLGPVEPR